MTRLEAINRLTETLRRVVVMGAWYAIGNPTLRWWAAATARLESREPAFRGLAEKLERAAAAPDAAAAAREIMDLAATLAAVRRNLAGPGLRWSLPDLGEPPPDPAAVPARGKRPVKRRDRL
jgi:hypothetical protein